MIRIIIWVSLVVILISCSTSKNLQDSKEGVINTPILINEGIIEEDTLIPQIELKTPSKPKWQIKKEMKYEDKKHKRETKADTKIEIAEIKKEKEVEKATVKKDENIGVVKEKEGTKQVKSNNKTEVKINKKKSIWVWILIAFVFGLIFKKLMGILIKMIKFM